MGAVRVIIHSIFGGRVNAPWGMALAQRTRELLGAGVEVQVQTSDDGIMRSGCRISAARHRCTRCSISRLLTSSTVSSTKSVAPPCSGRVSG